MAFLNRREGRLHSNPIAEATSFTDYDPIMGTATRETLSLESGGWVGKQPASSCSTARFTGWRDMYIGTAQPRGRATKPWLSAIQQRRSPTGIRPAAAS